MSKKEWETFFDLLEKIVDADLPTVRAKIEAVKEAASEQGGNAEMNLEEFVAWDFGF